MRKILDKLFQNKKLSIIIPIFVAFVMYLLAVCFSNAEDKLDLIITTPICCAVWFFGVFLIIFVQVKNSACPEWFLNLFELLAVTVFTLVSLIKIVPFLISGFQNFDLAICLGLVTFGAVSWAHSKRKIDAK